MDVPPTTPSPSTPYREGKPLEEIIPPDRRALKTAALVVGSMVAGVALWVVGGLVLETLRADARPDAAPLVPGYVAGRVPGARLHGPDADITLPPQRRSVINVWLQGCQDCMPAFEAMRELESSGGLGVSAPVVNVAYGEADLRWSQRYGVSTGLVFDPGGAQVVRPLGIGTFTTLVVDPDGSIIHRDRPDRPGYRQRVRSALGARDGDGNGDGEMPKAAAGDDPPTAPVAPLGEEAFDVRSVERVMASHRAAVKRQCWEHMPPPRPPHVSITLSMTIDPTGHVSRVSSKGDEPGIMSCLERNAKTWKFPAPASETHVNVPFRFVTE